MHSKPAFVSVFHCIECLSVSTRCQSLSFIASTLPNVQDRFYCDLPNEQDRFYCDLPNVQDEFHRNLPSVQDRPLVAFSQNVDASHADTGVESHQVLSANLVHSNFSQYSVKQLVHILLWCVSQCWLLLTGCLAPFLHLLVHFFSNAYPVFEHAYISPENQHHAAILVRVETMHFFLCSHDFVALQWRTGQILLCIHYSILYNIFRRNFSYLCTSTACLRGVRMQCFFVGHRWPIFVIVCTISHLTHFIYIFFHCCALCTNICLCLLAHIFNPESEYSTSQLLTSDSRYSLSHICSIHQLLTSDSSCLLSCLSLTQPCSNVLHTSTHTPCISFFLSYLESSFSFIFTDSYLALQKPCWWWWQIMSPLQFCFALHCIKAEYPEGSELFMLCCLCR